MGVSPSLFFSLISQPSLIQNIMAFLLSLPIAIWRIVLPSIFSLKAIPFPANLKI